jgi:uncharacterized phage protein (TIGR02220 family)
METAQWLDWFNRKFGHRFVLRNDLVKQVRALLAKRFTQEDMRLVALFKRDKWQDDPKMRDRLVPGTLLRSGTFGEYLDQAREWFGPSEGGHHG